ncbi:hypothetical protein [Eoetvoesiella caeni]
MANPRTPTALRILAGNPANRPLPASEPVFEPLDTTAPDWLTGGALERWNVLAPALEVNGMLNVGNRDALATYCMVLAEFVRKVQDGEDCDLKLVQQIRMLAREFGFTPSSQAGVVAPGKKQDETKKRFFG